MNTEKIIANTEGEIIMNTYKCVLAAVARDENLYLEEWIKHHLDLGIDEIALYDNMSKVPLQEEVDRLPEEYRCKVVVRTENAADPQITSYNKAFQYYRKKAEWMLFIDLDEFLVFEDGETLGNFLDTRSPDTGSVYLFMKTYNANGHRKYSPEPVQKRFTEEVEIEKDFGKSFVRCSHAWFMGIINPSLHKGNRVNADGNLITEATLNRPVLRRVYVKHYFTKSYEEWCNKMKRGSCQSEWRHKYTEFFKYNKDLEESCFDVSLSEWQMGFNVKEEEE